MKILKECRKEARIFREPVLKQIVWALDHLITGCKHYNTPKVCELDNRKQIYYNECRYCGKEKTLTRAQWLKKLEDMNGLD